MELSRRQLAPYLLLFVVVAAMLVAVVHGLRQENPPAPDSREAVAADLDRFPGIKMVLPTELPAGYDFGRFYGYGVDEPEDSLGGPKPVESRSVTFIPIGGVKDERGLPAVSVCVEHANSTGTLCPEPGGLGVQRTFEESVVTFYVASVGRRDLSRWKTLKLTTDLNKVSWLH